MKERLYKKTKRENRDLIEMLLELSEEDRRKIYYILVGLDLSRNYKNRKKPA